jgi:hypothetical protein
VRTGEEEEAKSQLWTAGPAAADRKEDDEDALEKTALVSSSVRGRMLGGRGGERRRGKRETGAGCTGEEGGVAEVVGRVLAELGRVRRSCREGESSRLRAGRD